MPSGLEYPEAYYTVNGQRYLISAADLVDKETLELAKTVFLTVQSVSRNHSTQSMKKWRKMVLFGQCTSSKVLVTRIVSKQ